MTQSKELKANRKLVLHRGARCAALVDPEQREECFGPMELDHILSKARGGGDNIENLQPLCRHHNTYKEDEPAWALRWELAKNSWDTIPRLSRGRTS